MDALIQSLNAQVIAALGPEIGPTAWFVGKSLTMILMVMVPVLIFVLYFQLVERWVIGWMQVRRGPNRVGP
jgi:NADH-quinone oxidoreductase subunit H